MDVAETGMVYSREKNLERETEVSQGDFSWQIPEP
jgi:hypothetical protein